MIKVMEYDNPGIGCYVDASTYSADACNRRAIEFAESYGFKTGYASTLEESDEERSQWLSEVADNTVDYLNTLETRSFMFWQFEDNSLFLMADVDGAREDVGFVSSKAQEYPDDDYEGEWLHVSDHGNATLYVREDGKDKEVWGVV